MHKHLLMKLLGSGWLGPPVCRAAEDGDVSIASDCCPPPKECRVEFDVQENPHV
jgi:hypothetical protein